ncbi:MAG: sigma-70 family RNA polymerase sigma factor [Phycisphaeraceae bacterium]|nr:MAG: sigma-70 family RNA polymerase sigma factor [Phycisphaeraceae bacterium]
MERSAFEQLALEHFDAVYRMALQLSRHPDEAADLTQETYLKGLRSCEGFEDRGAGVRPWLFKILHNIFYSRVRRERRGPISGAELIDAPDDASGPGDPPPCWDLASLDWQQVDGRLRKAVESLRPEFRSVLLLWGVEGLKYREIAEIQDIPIGTVMSRLHRARSILAGELAQLREEIDGAGR